MRGKVIVAMSGGVDSSVAAYLLKSQGYQVVGITMCLGVPSTMQGIDVSCCGAQAIADAKKVCNQLEIPHYVFDFGVPFKESVIRNFVEEYQQGRTPNPCVNCNRYLKFGLLKKKAEAMGFDLLATGHYARIDTSSTPALLKRPKDRRKDQTYFLYGTPPDVLPSLLLPLGDFVKEEVREIARNAHLPVAEKSESQDICFADAQGYTAFLEKMGIEDKSGEIVDTTGKVVGRHTGVSRYTVGQRKGLGIAAAAPLYVISIDASTNRVVVGSREDLSSRGLIADDVNLLMDLPPMGLSAQIRYAHKAAPCSARVEAGKLRVQFDEPQDAITPGQSVVLYHDDAVVGGGVIRDALT